MKRTGILVGALALMMLVGVTASAQGKFGPDSTNCVNFLNFYKDYLRQGNYKDASVQWSGAYRTCPPKASQNMIIDGQKIMRHKLSQSGLSAEERAKVLDTLLTLADVRAANFPKYAKKAAESKIFDKINYIKDGKVVVDEVKSYVNENGAATDGSVILSGMKTGIALYNQKQVDDEYVLSLYSFLSPVMADRAASNDKAKEHQAVMDQMFATSGVASCENIEKVFGPKVEANPEDKAMLQLVGGLLAKGECLESPLFVEVYSKIHKMNPSYKSAKALYQLSNKHGDLAKAQEYLKEAIESADIPADEKGDLLFELATYQYQKLNNSAAAIASAKEAVVCNPKNEGKAYFLMGTIWLNVKCSGNEMQQRAKYWVATDYFQKAKSDPELVEEANKYISRASVYYPRVEDAFMYDLSNGQSYSISCGGMSAVTTVRTVK